MLVKNKIEASNVLITGGAGFIGSHLTERLLEQGAHVICVDNFDPYYSPEIKRNNIKQALSNKYFTLIECDIRNKDELCRIFNNYKINSVVHLAARAGVRSSIINPLIYQDVNIGGTINLLDCVRENNIQCFIFGSSSSVYGASAKLPYKENDSISQPLSPYAASKHAGELFCYSYHHLYNIPITCLRFFTVYGPRQRPDMAIYKFTKLMHMGNEITVFGDGSSERDYTYVSDIIDGIVTSLNKKHNFEIINIGNSKTIKLHHLINIIEHSLNKKAIIKKLPRQPGDMVVTYADISKAQNLLDYHPNTKISEGIKNFVQWYLKRNL